MFFIMFDAYCGCYVTWGLSKFQIFAYVSDDYQVGYEN